MSLEVGDRVRDTLGGTGTVKDVEGRVCWIEYDGRPTIWYSFLPENLIPIRTVNDPVWDSVIYRTRVKEEYPKRSDR